MSVILSKLCYCFICKSEILYKWDLLYGYKIDLNKNIC